MIEHAIESRENRYRRKKKKNRVISSRSDEAHTLGKALT